MKIELTPEQVKAIVFEVCTAEFDETTQKQLALMVFARRNHIDPFIAAKAVVRQIARDHSMSVGYVLDELK